MFDKIDLYKTVHIPNYIDWDLWQYFCYRLYRGWVLEKYDPTNGHGYFSKGELTLVFCKEYTPQNEDYAMQVPIYEDISIAKLVFRDLYNDEIVTMITGK
jgi:hypothetical protein